jgi:hypothetical protein
MGRRKADLRAPEWVSGRKTNRRSYYPGGGEFIAAKSEGWRGQFTAQDYLRGHFWEVVIRMFPEVQCSLRALYDEKLAHSLINLFHSGHAEFFTAARSLTWPALKAWSEGWQLVDDWCIDRFLSKIYEWIPPSPTGKSLGRWEIKTPPFTPVPFLLPPSAWDPTEKLEATFKTELDQLYENTRDEYCEQVRKAALSAGYVPNTEFREPEHFRWLAGYQVYGWSQNRIAMAVQKDQAAVSRAINRLAGAIGLTLRPSKENRSSWSAERIRAALVSP